MAPKPYPACLCCHAPVQGILELRKRGVISAAGISQIAGVTCNVPQWYVGLIFEPRGTKERPRTPYEARFSAQWCMARALLDGGLDVWSFTREKISDPVAREFAEKVAWSAEELPEFPESFPARVTVTMHDGQRHVAYIAHNLGTPRNPMSAEDIERKFASCSEAAIGAAPTTRLSAAVDSLLLAAGADTFFTQLRSTVVAAGEAKGN
jgi:2-methylcitrate dehydratase PrpD